MSHKKTLHPNNKHNTVYNFKELCDTYPPLNEYVFVNTHKTSTIDFGDPKAVKALNSALLFTHYPIKFWKFPDENLCPPIPGRVDYIHYLADLLTQSGIQKDTKILDIGTGASCIYPILGNAVYKWKFVATEVDHYALKSAQNIIDKNQLKKEINLRHQKDKMQIFTDIINKEDTFEASMCNPPFFASQKEAKEANDAKQKGLGLNGSIRNFSGNHNELWYTGGEKAFLHNYLYQSSLFKKQVFWFTTLVSNKKNIKGMYQSLKKLKASDIKTIEMHQGNKISRIIAWTFLNDDEKKEWN